ncbi:MAG: GlpM family protein [Rhodospirillaceae bacterium]|nr:GlpM family protein [Rhodospirillaceae bacterium]
MDIVWKGLVGGLLTALIVALSKRGNVLPGILPLFPTFAIIALIVVGAKGSAEGFKEAALAGAKTIPAYLAFLGVCYFAIDHMDYRLALGFALGAWLLVVAAMFFGARLFN